MKQRFIVKRPKKLPPETKSAIQKVIKAESKTISKLRKRAKLERVELSQIHIQLTLYAMREHIKQMIKDLSENKYL